MQTTSLHTLRRNKGLTQREIAREIGVSRSTVSRLERGKNCRVSVLQRYIEAIGGKLSIQVRIPMSFVDMEDGHVVFPLYLN